MNKYRFLLISLVALLVASCVKDNLDQPEVANAEAQAAKKIINTSTDAVAGKLIFYVTEECAERLENAEVTRSGMNEIDLLAMELEASSIKPVFNLKVNAERKREMDMHRWYVVSFPTQIALDDAAKKLATIDYVEAVQFSKLVKRPTEQPVVVDPNSVPVTRADEYIFNDPGLYYQWHYINEGRVSLYPRAVEGEDINAGAAWQHTAGRPEVIVAVVDEGVCYTHEDLKDNMLVNEAELNGTQGVDDDQNGYVDDIYGYNFSEDGRNGRISWNDENDTGHGTHVAGTVAAVNNNGVGVAGVAGGSGVGDGVRILSAQIMSGDKVADYTSTAAAIEYAADRGASVLQCSWGFQANQIQNDSQFETGWSSVEYKALEYFIATKNCDALEGGLVIFAAGNEGLPIAGYPAAYHDYISVTAFAPDGLPAYYTCYDKGCNISAPGGEYYVVGGSWAETGCIYSTLPNNKYGYMQGTSMACPHVSGVAALGLSYALELGKTFTVDEFKALLLTSVNAFDADKFNATKPNPDPYGTGSLNLTSYRNKMGTGKLDAYRLLMAIRGIDCVPISTKNTTYVDFNKFMGDDKLTLKIKDYVIPEETIEALGIEFDAMVSGQLTIAATKAGVGTITVGMIAGGTQEGGGMVTAGMRIEKEFALIARPDVALDENLDSPIQSNGWL